ncbi:hypothetical protein [uncultured Roseobacter sp.]|uniref:hypothetical protein n=1 Tax=uncultured Roseobacter sp. TaxID=114847 RepID=UPI002631CA8C|nr:hypothetical protein [uncultured Roseobacter sp.]
MDEKLLIILPLNEAQASKLNDLAQYDGRDMPLMLTQLIEAAHKKYERRLEALYMEAEHRDRFPHLYDVDDEILF